MCLPAISVAAIFYEVAMRHLFNRPTVWAFDLSWWLAGSTYLLAGLYVMQQRAHIRITLLHEMMPRKWKLAADITSCILTCVFCFAVVWGGFNEAFAKLMRWEGLPTAWSPPVPAVMLPLILLTVSVIAVQSVCNLIMDWRNGEYEKDRSSQPAAGRGSSDSAGSPL